MVDKKKISKKELSDVMNKALGIPPDKYINFTALKTDELKLLAIRIKELITKANKKPTLGEAVETSLAKALEEYDGPIVSMLKDMVGFRGKNE